jgi:hypothetical protein
MDIGCQRPPAFDQPSRLGSDPTAATRADHAPATTRQSPVPPAYQTSYQENWQNLPHCRPFDHTMFDALDEYVAQKLPTGELYQALVDGRITEVHGIYPSHLAAAAEGLGYTSIDPVPFWSPKKVRRILNHVRPQYYRADNRRGEPVLLVAVTPGSDYVRHYAGLVRHHLFHYTSQAESMVRVIRYPEAERTLPLWTGLTDGFVADGDVVAMGYVQELGDELLSHAGATLMDDRESDYYWSRRIAMDNGPVISLLGVKFSFWGSIAATLCEAVCAAGADEIIYVGKLGALSTPADVYTRIFCPSRFVMMTHHQIRREVAAPPNGLLRRFPRIDSGCHISVPTVLEEDYMQRHAAGEVAAASIDNEISQMACAITDHNRRTSAAVRFTAVHFATDYVRKKSERHLHVPLNLSNNRMAVALEGKTAMLERICAAYLCPYLCGGTRR